MPGRSDKPGKPGSKLGDRLRNSGSAQGRTALVSELFEDGELEELLERVVEADGAVMIARTSDGGAFGFTFFVDNSRHRVYCSDREQWLALFTSLRE